MSTYLSRPLFPAFTMCVLGAALIPWAASILRTPLHSDLVWLYEGFVRLSSGQLMSESIFEPNPPLSLFTYAIPYFLTALTGLPSFITIFAYVMGLLGLSALVVRYLVAKITGPDSYAPLVVTAAFIISQTVMTTALFGERDHLIGIALIPFVLTQYAITKGLPVPRKLKWSVCFIGAVIILLKPHHGLIPFFMIAGRLIRQKNFHFMRDADFLSLALMIIAYGLLLIFCFADYRSVIFPDVARLYLTNISPDIFKKTALLMIPGLFMLGLAHIGRYKIRYANLVIFLTICAVASLIPYLVQGKGFFYHLFPAFGFFAPAAFLLLAGLIETEVKSMRLTVVMTIAGFLGLSYVVFPVNMKLPDYKAYHAMPLTKIVTDNCRGIQKCTFFMFNDSMGIVHETAYVTGLTHASRFPSYWFLPQMLAMDRRVPGSADTLRLNYAGRIAEDLERYKPQTLVVGRFGEEGGPFFDFAAYWAVSESFRLVWEGYDHTGTVDIAYGDYYPGTIAAAGKPVTYDVYRRRALSVD